MSNGSGWKALDQDLFNYLKTASQMKAISRTQELNLRKGQEQLSAFPLEHNADRPDIHPRQ